VPGGLAHVGILIRFALCWSSATLMKSNIVGGSGTPRGGIPPKCVDLVGNGVSKIVAASVIPPLAINRSYELTNIARSAARRRTSSGSFLHRNRRPTSWIRIVSALSG
jgi:hypothetical protein